MAGLQTDDVGEFHAFAIKGERHEVCNGLLLSISPLYATVAVFKKLPAMEAS